jgi:hypothetical protein
MVQTSVFAIRLNTFVERQAKDSFYHSQLWLEPITKLYGYSPITLTTTDGTGQITGMLPLCFLESPLAGRRLVSLPFSARYYQTSPLRHGEVVHVTTPAKNACSKTHCLAAGVCCECRNRGIACFGEVELEEEK